MLEKYKKEQPIAQKILNNILLKKEFNHAYLIETNNYKNSFDFILDFVKEIFLITNDDDINYLNQAINNFNYPELRIIEPDGGWIKKEQLLDLKEEFNKKAIIENKKIYIIKDSQYLNNVSSNTILKFLEEPQEGIIAILLCDNKYHLLETITSRCQIISLKNKDIDTDDYLVKITKELSLNNKELDDVFKHDISLKIDAVLNFIKYYEKNGKKILLFTNKYWTSYFNNKDDYLFGLQIMLFFYKDILNYKLNIDLKIFKDFILKIKDFSFNNNILEIINKIHFINETIKKIDYNANLNLLIDKLIIEMDGVYESSRNFV